MPWFSRLFCLLANSGELLYPVGLISPHSLSGCVRIRSILQCKLKIVNFVGPPNCAHWKTVELLKGNVGNCETVKGTVEGIVEP